MSSSPGLSLCPDSFTPSDWPLSCACCQRDRHTPTPSLTFISLPAAMAPPSVASDSQLRYGLRGGSPSTGLGPLAKTLTDTQALGEKTPWTGWGWGRRQCPMLALLISVLPFAGSLASRAEHAFLSLRHHVRAPGLVPRAVAPGSSQPRPASRTISPHVAPHPSLRPAPVSRLSGCLFVPSPPVIAGWCLGTLRVPEGRCPEAGPRSSSSFPITGPERPCQLRLQ